MSPLPILRRGFTTALLLSVILLNPHNSKAQEKDDEKKIDRYVYAVRFGVTEKTVITAEEFAKAKAILDKFKSSIPPEIQAKFNVQGELADKKPELNSTEEQTLKNLSRQFFLELKEAGLDMQKMQGFKTDYQKKNIMPGDLPLDPQLAWMKEYQAIEKSLMGGRTLMVMEVWKQSLIEFFDAHPEAIGVIYGQLDIGSWVKMSVRGLKFSADIDFSSLATNDILNKELVRRFGDRLKNVSGLSMKELDAQLTQHGQAGADVYIGEWGKIFAEKFGKLKLLEVIKENGHVVEVKMIEVESKAILIQKAMEVEKNSLKRNPGNNYELKTDIELKMDMEPMFSLEMLRHAVTDAEKGPFEGMQKIIKMIKCAERSFTIQKMASENTSYKPDLTEKENKLRTLCEEVAKVKDNHLKVSELLEAFGGKKFESMTEVNELVTDMVQQCKQAMLKNSIQAFGFRIRSIAEIKDETQRYAEADKFLADLQEEFNKGFKKGGVDVPKSMQRARTILWEFRNGKIPPEMMETKMQELNKLMEEEFKVDKSFMEKWVGDAWVGLKDYLLKRGYDPKDVVKIIEGWKLKIAKGWAKYAPDLIQEGATSTYKFANHITEKCKAFDESLLKTKPGIALHKALTAAGYADMALSLYEAAASGKNIYESTKNVATSLVLILAQAYVPPLAIPLGIYHTVQTHNITPAIVGVLFYLFPVHFGGTYAVTNLIDKLIIKKISDRNFHFHLDKMTLMSVTDGQGHVISFKIPNKFTELGGIFGGSPDSTETQPTIPIDEPGRTQVLKEVVYDMAVDHCPSIKYFKRLIPTKEDTWGEYDQKTSELIRLFYFDPEFGGYISLIDSLKRRKTNGWLPVDDFASNRDKILDDLQIGIEDYFWKAVLDAIESGKKSEKEGVVAKLEAEIVSLQDALFLGDYNMKKIDSLSLLLKIRKQISQDPQYLQALGEKYAAGNAYERVAIPTLEMYILTYKQILAIQKKIFDIWRPFGVDGSKLQDKTMRLLLQGGLVGSPMLTTNAEADMKVAIQCLDAHQKKASEIRIDLANALGRPIKETEKEDKEHLRILGQLGFGIERLIDADNEGRSPLFKDDDGGIDKQRGELARAYRDYLAKLKEGPALDLTLKMEAENSTTETNPVTAKVSIFDNKTKKLIPLPANTTIEWWLLDADTRKDVKVAEGAACTNDASKQGGFTYSVRLIKKANNKTTTVATSNWYLEVKRFDATDPKKGIVLKAPDVIKQYDIVDVSFTLPAALKGRQLKCNWGYSTIGKSDDCSGAKIQYNYELSFTDKDGKKFLRDSTTVDAYITVMIPGKTYGDVYNISKKVKFQHMSINVKASDIWTGGSGPNWFRIDRKAISNPPRYAGWMNDPAKKPKSTASAYATVGLKDDDPFETINTLEDLKALMEKKAKEQAYRKLEVKPVSVGDFKGYGLYSEPRYSRGSWSFEGYTSAGAGSSFSGYVMKGKKIFEVYWSAGAGGAFDNSDQGWMMSMVKQLAKEAEGILIAASFQPDGRLTKTPYTGPKLDGSDFPQVSIEPKVDTVLPGSKVTVKAVISNDKPEYGPYTYSWSGNVEGNANEGTVQLESERPGKKTISVQVDGTLPPGGASMEYVVAPLKVKITKISPPAQTIIVGMPVELRADFTGPVPAGKKLQYLWQPHPEEKFEPFEGAGNTTKVVFTKPGNKKVWVQVLDKTTAETITMGESDQLEFVVEKPAFTISFNPATAKVGELVVAKISSKPEKLEEVSYRWMPLPSNAVQLKESTDGSEITFYAKDALQIPFEVLSLVKGSGEELGRTKGYFNAERYVVKAEGPKVQGPKPMIWQPGVGLVEVDKEIAVHQIVEFSTIITPSPSSDLTYNWQVIEGNASVSNPTSRDARVTALETGNITIRVAVKDKNGVELGNATGVFNATISQEMISNANNQKKLFEEKMKQARQLMNDGKLDESVKLGLELKGMNARDAAPLLNELGAACKKDATTAATERDFEKAIKRCNQALELNPADAAAKKQLEDNKKWALEWATVDAKGSELESQVNKKDLPTAEKALADLRRLQQNMPGKTDNKWTRDKEALFHALVKSCDSAYAITNKNSAQSFNSNDFEGCVKELQTFRSVFTPMAAMQKEIDIVLDQCKNKITEQKKVYTDFQQLKSRFEQGQPADPAKGPEYIEATALNTFSKKDPRQQEMIVFAGVMKNKQQETTAIKTRAEKLKAEGQAAEEAGNTGLAIRKYKESIALLPDPELEAYIRILETIENEPPGKPDVIKGNWSTQAHEFRQNVGKQYTYYFPPGGNLNGGLWGTDMYTTDGSIAKAAVHAGLITVKDGGTVTIEIRPGMPSYAGSTRNGVTSNSWGAFHASFVFVKKNTDPDETEMGALQLVAWYPFNGNAQDESGKGRHGTLRNGVSMTKDRFDKENSAFYFDGADDYIDISATGLPTKDRTVMFWMKPAPGSQPSYPVTYGGGPGCGYSFLMGYNAGGSKRFNTQGHCGTNALSNDPWLMDPSNQWRHFTVTISGKTIKIYINGILLKSNTGFSQPTFVEGKKLILGGLVGPEGTTPYVDASGGYFKGALDEIRIYRGAMNDEQVRAAVTEQQTGTVKEPVKEDKGVTPADPKTEKKIFENGNIGGVSSGPPNPTKITFNMATFITRIENYHYFNRGVKPGTIALRHSNGTLYGPWQAYGILGQGGVQNASWVVQPDIEVPAGTYTVIDSDPSTWSYNSESRGCGFTQVWTSLIKENPVIGVKPADPAKEEKTFNNGNIGGVQSGPPNPTKITFNQPAFITRIENYHYFNGGKKPGTIGLRHTNGTLYGPWQAYGILGQGGVQNASWVVQPDLEVPAGTYTVIDSDPSTWSYNSESRGCGFTQVWTAKKGTAPVTETWKGIFNVVWGALAEIQLINGQYSGRMSIGGGTWETMEDLVIKDNKISFHRVNGNQYFNGTISGGVMKGTFTSGGRTGQNYEWELRREGAAISGTTPGKPGYTIEEVGGGVTAEQICITGDIDNLGFGFPKGFDVFSGNSTPSHGYPWKTDPNDAKGTDCIMVGTGAKSNSDGYSSNTSRPGNQPQPITLSCMTAGTNIRSAVLQLFVDDFQATAFGSKFSVTINGRQAAFLETVLNSLNQTGPIGKLISVQLPADFISEIETGQLAIFIDDATTGRGDGYAVDFVRLIINPTSYSYTGTITGIILRPDGQPAAGASINAGGIISTTANSKGEFTLNNVPAGMVSINASYNNHHHKTISTDLASGKTIRVTINLPPDDAVITTQPPDNNEGVVTKVSGILYGTVFKTKEEAGKTNPFDLEGVPLPNTRVEIQYTYSGTTYTKWVTSDGNGKFQFTGLPLNVTISASSRGQLVSKTLTTASPKQYVQFGWDGEIIINQP